MNKRQTNTKVDTIMTTITIQYDCFQAQMLSKKEINRLMFNTEFKWMSTLQLKTWKKCHFMGRKQKISQAAVVTFSRLQVVHGEFEALATPDYPHRVPLIIIEV